MAGAPRRLVSRVHTAVLHALTRRRGVRRVVNGEPFFVDARVRGAFGGSYDAGASAMLRQRVRPGGHYWNVGANVGVYRRDAAVGAAGSAW